MKTLEEYRKEVEQDPKARRRLKKLEREFEAATESLTDEELVKYGLKAEEPAESEKPEEPEVSAASGGSAEPAESGKPEESAPENAAAREAPGATGRIGGEASSVIDLICRKI